MTTPVDEFNFEKTIAELDQIVAQMEQGGISLEQSLKNFEQGVKLIRLCQGALQDAEQKVQLLLEKNGNLVLEPYQIDNES